MLEANIEEVEWHNFRPSDLHSCLTAKMLTKTAIPLEGCHKSGMWNYINDVYTSHTVPIRDKGYCRAMSVCPSVRPSHPRCRFTDLGSMNPIDYGTSMLIFYDSVALWKIIMHFTTHNISPILFISLVQNQIW